MGRARILLMLGAAVLADVALPAHGTAGRDASPFAGASADERAAAVAAAWTTFQRSCRPCHGSLGAGDGPYARSFARPASSLLVARAPAERFRWIADGLAISERPWESAMPAYRTRLGERRVWGMVLLLEELAREHREVDPAATAAGLFGRRCAVCHGGEGRGDGPLAAELLPRPRDLTRPWYRFRSTPSGGPPLAADLVRTLTRGLGTTAMGSFAALGEPRLAALGTHVLALAGAAPVPPATALPEAPASPDVERGRRIYDDARCWQCHGEEGRGDGPTARELRDDAGHASLPANLTQRWRLKGGAAPADLARAIAHGLNGTPMPSYGEVLEPDELAALAAYVRALGRPRPEVPAALPVRALDGAVPLAADDARWEGVAETALPLGPQLMAAPGWDRPAVDAVAVAVAASPEGVAIRVVWDDRFEDRTGEDAAAATATAVHDPARLGRWRLPDRLAVQLAAPAADGSLPPLHLGSPARPVVRWLWTAAEGVRAEEARGADTVRELPGPALRAAATFSAGRWRLVLSAAHDDPAAAGLLAPGATAALAIQAWDGAHGEQGPRHGLSSWVILRIPAPPAGARS